MGKAAPAIEGLVLLPITLVLAVGFGMPTLWLLVPFALITLTGRAYEEYGLTLDRPGSLRFHLGLCAVIFGGYALGHYLFGRWFLGLRFSPELPPAFPRVALEQLLVIGLSEEFFFRGYLQTQLNRWLGRPYKFLGAEWGWGLICTALLFGVCHVATTGNWTRLDTAFFGLFAGWLRERSGTIAVPAAYHGIANLIRDFMSRSLH